MLDIKTLVINKLSLIYGGEGGIRTHGTHKGSTVFETARFNHSRTSPHFSAQYNHTPSAPLRP